MNKDSFILQNKDGLRSGDTSALQQPPARTPQLHVDIAEQATHGHCRLLSGMCRRRLRSRRTNLRVIGVYPRVQRVTCSTFLRACLLDFVVLSTTTRPTSPPFLYTFCPSVYCLRVLGVYPRVQHVTWVLVCSVGGVIEEARVQKRGTRTVRGPCTRDTRQSTRNHDNMPTPPAHFAVPSRSMRFRSYTQLHPTSVLYASCHVLELLLLLV